jgi:hypothetical protein
MQRLKVLVLASMALVAVGAFVSATAVALPTLLNSKKEVVSAIEKYTGTSGVTELVRLNGEAVTCKASKAKGQFEAKSVLGPFEIDFEKCSGKRFGVTAPCTGAGEAKEVILVTGEAHLVNDVLTPEKGVAVLFLIPTAVHFTCEALGQKVLILTKGQVLCLIKPVGKLEKHFTISCTQGKPGDPGEATYWNDSGTAVDLKEGLLSSENEGKTFEMSSQVGEGLILTALEVEIMA